MGNDSEVLLIYRIIHSNNYLCLSNGRHAAFKFIAIIQITKFGCMKKLIVSIFLGAVLFTSCVPIKMYTDEKKMKEECNITKDSLQIEVTNLRSKTAELESKVHTLTNELAISTELKDSLQKFASNLQEEAKQLENLNKSLLDDKGQLVKANAEEAKKLLSEIQIAREDLQKREDELDLLEERLSKEKERLSKLNEELVERDRQIVQKNAKISELEQYLRRKDSITNLLKEKIAKALYGFEEQGLTIEQKNGKIYVSLDEQLLFQVGKSEVSSKGLEALKKLAEVLEKNPEINILVEGHTDNTGGEKLNWKLSTERALSITYILLDNSAISKNRITAAGRGQFAPLDPADTPEARKKNRRSEIILTPKLDELFDIIK